MNAVNSMLEGCIRGIVCHIVCLTLLSLPAISQDAVAQDLLELLPLPWKKTSEALADEAREALSRKDYDRAMALLQRAIESNPGDAGATYDCSALPNCEAVSLKYGRRQAEGMLRDRPLMQLYVQPDDDLLAWIYRKYASDVPGLLVEWDSSEVTAGNLDAEHTRPFDGAPARIRIRNIMIDPQLAADEAVLRKAAAFDQLWKCAVFELHNVENYRVFDRVEADAFNGQIDRNDFVKTLFVTELRASQRTRKWYVQVYLPHVKKHDLPTDSDKWYCTMWGSPDSIFSRYTDRQSYPWNPYLAYYEKIVSLRRESERGN